MFVVDATIPVIDALAIPPGLICRITWLGYYISDEAWVGVHLGGSGAAAAANRGF
ncbi:hypothetical protein SGCOL_011966 [Colletotrichum sp. CLE4]